MYRESRSVEIDDEEATRRWLFASNQGHGEAGTERIVQARAGNPNAQFDLGWMCRQGLELDRDDN